MLAAVPVAAILGVALLAPASASACPAGGVCTNSLGEYTLTVPPLPTTPPYGEFRDCKWDVHVDFGDGTSQNYVFEGEEGLTGSHTFPSYGKYVVKFTLSNGEHTKIGGSCPGLQESKNVYYQSPQEIAAEEAQIKAEKEAKEKREAEEKAAKEAKKQHEIEEREAREKAAEERFGGAGGSGPEGSSGDGSQAGQGAYWHACRGRIQVHAVGCQKARKVIGRARRRNLFEEGPQEILGFTCHLTGTRPAQISCRRGKSRVLGPL